jgi:hypothetical protein
MMTEEGGLGCEGSKEVEDTGGKEVAIVCTSS